MEYQINDMQAISGDVWTYYRGYGNEGNGDIIQQIPVSSQAELNCFWLKDFATSEEQYDHRWGVRNI